MGWWWWWKCISSKFQTHCCLVKWTHVKTRGDDAKIIKNHQCSLHCTLQWVSNLKTKKWIGCVAVCGLSSVVGSFVTTTGFLSESPSSPTQVWLSDNLIVIIQWTIHSDWLPYWNANHWINEQSSNSPTKLQKYPFIYTSTTVADSQANCWPKMSGHFTNCCGKFLVPAWTLWRDTKV